MFYLVIVELGFAIHRQSRLRKTHATRPSSIMISQNNTHLFGELCFFSLKGKEELLGKPCMGTEMNSGKILHLINLPSIHTVLGL